MATTRRQGGPGLIDEMAVDDMPDAPGSRAPWMGAKESALYLGVDRRTLLAWARQGKLKGYMLSGAERHVWRFLIEDLDACMIAAPAVLR